MRDPLRGSILHYRALVVPARKIALRPMTANKLIFPETIQFSMSLTGRGTPFFGNSRVIILLVFGNIIENY